MKKIMILGASILQVPAILEAKKMGLYVIAVDMNASAIGFQYADKCAVISTIDIPEVLKVAKEENIDGIMTIASDMPMRTVATVSKELGLIGIDEETAIKATNKYEMRKALEKENIPIPKFIRVSNYEEYKEEIERFKLPYILKPVDNSGSRGIYLVRNSTEEELAFEYTKKYSRNGDVLIEEFMQGQEVSVESMTIEGETHIIAITDKLTTGAPKFVEMGHSEPSRASNEIKEKICKITKAAVKAIGIKNGPSHTEVMITEDGPKIVELGARLGGDNITTHLVPLSTGVNIVKANIECALGMKVDLETKFQKGSAIRFFEQKDGTLKEINGIEEVMQNQKVKEVVINRKIGEKTGEINNSSDRIGYVVSQGDNAEDAIKICEEAMKKVNIKIEDQIM